MIELLLAAERMLAVGLLDNAERLFRQVADADPRNAIAVVGLARVALERGDEPGAIAEARRALDIDPENVAAQRMIERLEEVLETRQGGPPQTAPVPEPATAPESKSASKALPEPAPEVLSPPAPSTPTTPTQAEPTTSLLDRLLRFLRLR